MTASEMASTSPSSSRNATRRYIVFDGSTDFQLWRARVENELLRFHLLGYIYVKDYDGSQAFTYNSEEIPPKCGMVSVPATSLTGSVHAEQLAASHNDANVATALGSNSNVLIKDEPAHQIHIVGAQRPDGSDAGNKPARTGVVLQQGRLSRLEVIAERAEAMSILQRYLHPEVERAILGKNIYDSWATLCSMYGNRNVSDFYTVHRLLHSMQLGEKQGESAQDFIARLALLMEQYAQIAGIHVTDPFRSMVLANALPKSWMPLLDGWRAFKPYIPYAQLVEKVTLEATSRQELKERDDALAAQTSDSQTPSTTLQVATDAKGSASGIGPTPSPASSQRSKASPVSHKASASASDKSKASHSRSDDKRSAKSEERGSEKHSERSSQSSKRDDYKRDDRDYDRKRDDRKRDDDKRDDKRDDYRRDDKRDDYRRDDKRDDRRSDKSYESKRSDGRDYDSRRSDDRDYDRKRDDWRDSSSAYDKRDATGFHKQVCYYCLKQGHRFYTCWFLRVDIENGTWVNPHKKFSATVTSERTPSMVQRLEQYVREVRMRDQPHAGAAKPFEDPYDTQAQAFLAENAFAPSASGSAYHYGDAQAPGQQQLPMEPPQTPSRSYSELASMRSQSMFHENVPLQQQQHQRQQAYLSTSSGYASGVAPAAQVAEPDAERYKKRSRSDFGGDPEQSEVALTRDPRTRASGFHHAPSASGSAP